MVGKRVVDPLDEDQGDDGNGRAAKLDEDLAAPAQLVLVVDQPHHESKAAAQQQSHQACRFLGIVDGGSQRRNTSTATNTVIVKAATMDTPPRRGISP